MANSDSGRYPGVDCYGLERNERGYISIPLMETEVSQCTDATVLGELHSLKMPIAGLEPLDTSPSYDGKRRPHRYVITSPNVYWIPDLSEDNHIVWVRDDGRFYVHDFMYFPQWYHEGTYYFPFVRAPPSADALKDHPYRLAWYQMTDEDFVRDPLNPEIGWITRQLSDKIVKLRDTLRREALQVYLRHTRIDNVFRDLRHAVRGMSMFSCLLSFAPQTHLMTLLTLTKFQRFLLETVALIEYADKWRFPPPGLGPTKVDTSIIGAVTADIVVAQDLFTLGVPVWLVRPPSRVPACIVVRSYADPTIPPGLRKLIYYGSVRVFSGPPSAVRNRACQAMRTVNINLGHSSLELHPGDADQPVYQVDGAANPESRGDSTIPASRSSVPVASASGSVIPSGMPSSTPVASSVTAVSPSTPSAPVASSSVPPKIHVNEDKFKEPASDLCPPVLPVWSTALSSVIHQDRKLVDHDQRQFFRGYLVVDPYILAKESNAKQALSWLLVRASWMYEMLKPKKFKSDDGGYPRPQNWRNFLSKLATDRGFCALVEGLEEVVGQKRQISASEDPGPQSKKSKNSASRQERNKRNNEARRQRNKAHENPMFDFADSLLASTTDRPRILWNNVEVMSSSGEVKLSTNILRQVVWDAFENNFRLELLALDRCILLQSGATLNECAEREELVSKVFPGGKWFVTLYPVWDEGLGASCWKDRAEYVAALQDVVFQWPGVPSATLQSHSAGKWEDDVFIGHEAGVLALEAVIYPFYCQTFFDYFGRAPTIPHCLP